MQPRFWSLLVQHFPDRFREHPAQLGAPFRRRVRAVVRLGRTPFHEAGVEPDLAAREKAATDLARTLHHWKTDPDLAGVRDRLEEVPAAEREAWKSLWANVDVLLARAPKAN